MIKTMARIVLLVLLFHPARAGGPLPRVEPAPSWIRTTDISQKTSLDDDADDGYVYLVSEQQIHIGQQRTYCRRVLRMLSEAGVQNGSEISVSFDPSFQQLIFHQIRILRNGQVIDQLDRSKFRVIDEENERGSFIYQGDKTAIFQPRGVQKGDLLEFSYTIQGFNPLFLPRWAGVLDLQYGVPMYGIYHRILLPRGRSLQLRNHASELVPKRTETPEGTLYEWELSEVAPLRVEEKVPIWYDPYPVVQVSEFAGWSDVVRSLMPHYSLERAVSAAVQRKAEELRKAHPESEARLLAALRYVQDKIRYLGLELGTNAHAPRLPDEVMELGYGDCKEKALLFCALLKALGVEAWPMLVNTESKQEVMKLLPSPYAFDHCVVAVRWNGGWKFFDPTISFQRGPLEAISFPAYGAGLLIAPGVTGLLTLPRKVAGNVDCREVFDARRRSGPVQLTVTTHYSGSFADDARSDFGSVSLRETGKSYREFYARHFEGIELDTVYFRDNETTGVFTVVEQYSIPDFWTKSANEWTATVQSYVINGMISRPERGERSMPFLLPYPAHYREEVTVLLEGGASNLGRTSEEFLHPSFQYSYDYHPANDSTVRLVYEYESRQDHVTPEEASAYFNRLKLMDDHGAYEFSVNPDVRVKSARSTVELSSDSKFFLGYVLLGILVLITFIVRVRRR